MPDTPERDRRRWAYVIATGLLLVGLTAWKAPASSSPLQSTDSRLDVRRLRGRGVLTLVALFVAHRSATAGVVINGTRYEGPWDGASLLGGLQAAYAAPRQ